MHPGKLGWLILLVVAAGATTGASHRRGPDRVRLLQNTKVSEGFEGPETAVYLDARTDDGSCHNDLKAPASLKFTNLLDATAVPPCALTDEVVVFSVDDALAMDQAAGGKSLWTDDPGDEVTIRLSKPPLAVPLILWVVSPDAGPASCVDGDEVSLDPLCDVAVLPLAFNLQRAGIDFDVEVRDVRREAGASAAVGHFCKESLAASAFYDARSLNVYYVDGIDNGADGYFCSDVGAGNIIYMDQSSRPDILLGHELGHALGLEHVTRAGTFASYDTPADEEFSSDNLMSSYPAGQELRMGQVFRINLSESSWLNRAGLRGDQPARQCEPGLDAEPAAHREVASTDGPCPRISRPW